MRIVLIEIEGHGPIFIDEPPLLVEQEFAARKHGRLPPMGPSEEVEAPRRPRPLPGPGRQDARRDLGSTPAADRSRRALLRELRRSPHLTIEHPARLAGDAVERTWKDYLVGRERKHRKWLIIDASLAPISILLGPLPGPNIVCYWLFYRSVIHFLARRGASRASAGGLPITLRPRPELDATIRTGDDEEIARLAEALEFPDLASILVRLFPEPAAEPRELAV